MVERNPAHLKAVANTLKLMAHPVRLSMLCPLACEGEMAVGDLAEREKTRASQFRV